MRELTDSATKKASPVPFGPVYAAIPTPLTSDGSLAVSEIAHNIQKYVLAPLRV